MKLEEIFDNSLFLFGAGASKEAGCKISREMIQDLEDSITHYQKKQVLDFLLSSLQYHSKWKSLKDKTFKQDEPNIEDLLLLIRRITKRDYFLPYPVTGSWADKIQYFEAIKSPSLFLDLEQEIHEKLNEWVDFKNDNLKYLGPITDLLKANPNANIMLDIFTLNYDTVLETYFNSDDATILNSGFTSGKYVGFHDRKQFESYRINYYKLHGSIDWVKLDDGSIMEDDKAPSNSQIHTEQLIQFGHGTKFLSVEPFISLLYEFKQQLEQKKYIFTIGYSFFDSYINNLILEGLQKPTSHGSKKLININPTHISNNMISSIQKSAYLSDLPEFNITDISQSIIKNIPLKTGAFLKRYFANNGKELIELINKIKSEDEDIF